MTVYGFQTGGKPTYGAGQAAHMTPGDAPVRSKLYTHRFPGAHSKTQVMGAITLAIDAGSSSFSPGAEMDVRVHVDNERTGHKMPSGSSDLRQLWLSLEANIGGRTIPVPARPARRIDAHDVVGSGSFDQLLLGQDIPRGSRIYRAIFVDETGKPTLSSYSYFFHLPQPKAGETSKIQPPRKSRQERACCSKATIPRPKSISSWRRHCRASLQQRRALA